MPQADRFEIFLATAPGLEEVLCAEADEAGFANARTLPGGVAVDGGWPDVWRANLQIRGANRVLARIGEFRVVHLAQLDKRARRIDWLNYLKPGVPVRVEASCRKSKIYHAGAATQRVETAIRETAGVEIDAEAPVRIMVRIDNNICTISLDTSGELLHRRGYKEAVGKAPLRETLAALFLRQCGYCGTETIVDPMCGSGTFVLEGAEMSSGLLPGRSRSFAFEHLAGFDEAAWQALKEENSVAAPAPDLVHHGSDRNAAAIRISQSNAERGGLAEHTRFAVGDVADLEPPPGAPGLVMINPPYGARIGSKKTLFALYAGLGRVLFDRFKGWRVGLVTSDQALARATRLPFAKPGRPVEHGGLKVRLYRGDAL